MSMWMCDSHGGHGFKSDCIECDRIRKLKAENKALREALTPSTETKRAYWGSDDVDIPSSWHEIKAVMRHVRERADTPKEYKS